MSLASRLSGAIPAGPSFSSSQRDPIRPASTGRTPAKSRQRPAPYVKSGLPSVSAVTSRSASNPIPPQSQTTSSDGQWKHDLFNPLSDLYHPVLNTSAPNSRIRSASQPKDLFSKAVGGIKQPNPSLRPFGDATPPIKTTTGALSPVSAAIEPANYASNDLFDRLGVKGMNVDSDMMQVSLQRADERKERQRQIAMKEEEARQKERSKKEAAAARSREQHRLEEEERVQHKILEQAELDQMASRREEEEVQQSGLLEEQRKQAFQRQQQPHQQVQQQGTLVIVKNLVDGTTPEDVKAAFADFGVIMDCRILGSNGDVLDMQVEFHDRKDAMMAVEKLDGALADGRTLRLSIQERPPPAPTSIAGGSGSFSLKDRLGIPLKGLQSRQANGQSHVPLTTSLESRNGSIPTGPRGQAQRQAQPYQQTLQREVPKHEAAKRAPVVLSESSSKMRSDQVAHFDPRAVFQSEPEKHQYAGHHQQQQQQRHQGHIHSPARDFQRVSSTTNSGQRKGGRGQGAIESASFGGNLLSRLGRKGSDGMDLG